MYLFKNTIFVRKTFLFTPFPRKGAGKEYQVRKLVSWPSLQNFGKGWTLPTRHRVNIYLFRVAGFEPATFCWDR